MTPEQINAALARWLGWERDNFPHVTEHDRITWHIRNGKVYYGKPFEIEGKYDRMFHEWNPYGRIDHAWLCVNHALKTPAHSRKFARWCDRQGHNAFYLPGEDAARAICEAIIEICEVEV